MKYSGEYNDLIQISQFYTSHFGSGTIGWARRMIFPGIADDTGISGTGAGKYMAIIGREVRGIAQAGHPLHFIHELPST